MNGTITYTYDVRDRLSTAMDAKGNTISFAYDAKGRMISRTDAGGTTHLTYDDLGNVLTAKDVSGSVTTFTYTLSNQVASVTDALGNKQMLAYDVNSNLLSVTDALGKSTQYAYDAVNRLSGVTDAYGKVTAIAYDANGNVVSLTDPNGHAQSYTYDAANRLATYKDGAGNTYGYTYDATGNITQLAKPTGTIASTYDALNRLTRVVNSSGDTYTFAYDANDNIVSMGNDAGTTALVYDDLNRLTTYTDPFNKQVEFEYDAAGNKTAVTYPGNKVVRYTYDNAHRMQTVTDWKGNVYSYAYDADGRVKKLDYPNGISCNYSYDAAGRLKEKKNMLTADGTVISSSAFTLDVAGRRVQEERQGAVVSNIPAKDLTYTYSPNDALLSDSETTYTNDLSGNRISQSGGGGTLSYDFTVDNLLASSSDGSVATAYTYNPLGHRIQKSQGDEAIRYVLDLSGELSLVLQTTDEAGAVQADYVYGLGLLARIDKEDKIQFYHFDAQHNTVALTDADGNITDTYTYDPFGTMLTHLGETEQPFTFLGAFGVEQESEGLYYVRARYYDAENGRFLSVDPYYLFVTDPQTINRFVYSLNNPLSVFDPSGMIGLKSYGMSIVQSIGATYKLISAGIKFVTAEALTATVVGAFVAPLLLVSAGNDVNEATKIYQAARNNVFNSGDIARASDYKGWVFDDLYSKKELQFVFTISDAISVIAVPSNFFNAVTAYKYIGKLPSATIAFLQSSANIIDLVPYAFNSVNEIVKSVCPLSNNKSNLPFKSTVGCK